MSGEETELRIDLAILGAKEALTAIAELKNGMASLEQRIYQLEYPTEHGEGN
jgi:hypothetical protein